MSWPPAAAPVPRGSWLGYAVPVPRPFRKLLSVLLLAAAPAGWALDVRWALVDGPPYHMKTALGPSAGLKDLGDGLMDQLIQGVAGQAPELHHQFVPMSRSRLWRAMQAGEPLCYPNAFRTPERLRFAHFTVVMPPTPQILVTRKGQLPDTPEVSLATVLARTDLSGAFEVDRSYGTHLDALIRQAGPHVRALTLPESPQLLRMLEAGRMDYLVEYPPAILYMQEHLQPRPELAFHAITEERDAQATYIACTRSAWGLKVTQALDQAIRRWSATPKAAQFLLRWQPPGIAQREAARVEGFYRERALSSQVE